MITSTWADLFAPARDRRARVVDVVLVATLAVLQVGGTLVYSSDEAASPWSFDLVALALLLVGPIAMLGRRRWPEVALLVALGAAAGYVATDYPRGPAGFPAFIAALVGVFMVGRRLLAWSVLVVAFVAFWLLPSISPDEVEDVRSVVGTAADLVWLPLVGAGSEMARLRLERRADRDHAEREEDRRRASDERLRIAREVHDVLAHNISLINVRSAVALHLLEDHPEQVRPALEAISTASEEALDELRSALDVLRLGARADRSQRPPGDRPRRPPGLSDLDGLVRRIQAAGVSVHVDVEGDTSSTTSAVDLAVFRIVHAPSEVVVQVDDDGTATPCAAPGGGRGITGMRERADALGGVLAAGPRPGRGFRVRAQVPLRKGSDT